MQYGHIPVMLDEVLYYLNCVPGKIYVDGTLGGGGHAKAICRIISPGGSLIGIDRDLDSIKYAETVLQSYTLSISLFHDSFTNLNQILSQLHISAVDGILLDLGLSLHQLESSGRGFSFKRDEPLDMRMNIKSKIKAKDIVNTFNENDLKKIIKNFGEERYAGIIARNIVRARRLESIETSKRLADIVSSAVYKKGYKSRRIHPATRVFQALRIAVNKELDRLESFLNKAPDMLNKNGRLCVISFHSLEDRIVKRWIKKMEGECLCPPGLPICNCNKTSVFRSLFKKVKKPSEKEIINNPMARSAKLRAAEKL